MKDKIKLPWWYYIFMIIVFVLVVCTIEYKPSKNGYFFYKNRINATIKKIKFLSADTYQANVFHFYYDDNHYLSYIKKDKLHIGDSIVKEKENSFNFKVYRNGIFLYEQNDTLAKLDKIIKCYKFFIPNFGNK